MPGRDGTGPMGYMTRRSRYFNKRDSFDMGCGFGKGYGYRGVRNFKRRFPGFIEDEIESYDISEKDAIKREKELLESRLEFLNTQLNNLKED